MSIQAYQRASAQAETPREAEYRIFAMVTADLIRVQEQGRTNLSALSAALDRNRRLWSALSQDCAQPGNELPTMLRAQIISLGLWVSRHSSAVMCEGEELAPLIDLNRSMMQGLAPQGAAPGAMVGAGQGAATGASPSPSSAPAR